MRGPWFQQLLVLGPRVQSGRKHPVARRLWGEQLVTREARPTNDTATLRPWQDPQATVKLLRVLAVQTGPGRQCSLRRKTQERGKISAG